MALGIFFLVLCLNVPLSTTTHKIPDEQVNYNDLFLEPTNIPFYPKTAVYGAIIANNSDLKELVREKYPDLYRLIQCESTWRTEAVGSEGEIGLAQFKPSSWDWFEQVLAFYGDINNPQDQIEMLYRAAKAGYISHWPICGKYYANY